MRALDIHLCQICEEFVGSDEAALKSHITRSHVATREVTNLDILTETLYGTVAHTNRNHWEAGLSFLRSLHISEPTFRQSLINKIHGRTEDAVLETAIDLITATVTANKTAKAKRLLDHSEYDPTPFWLLLVLFEQLVLFPSIDPKKDDPKNSLNQLIHHRLRLFRSSNYMKKAAKLLARHLNNLQSLQTLYNDQPKQLRTLIISLQRKLVSRRRHQSHQLLTEQMAISMPFASSHPHH